MYNLTYIYILESSRARFARALDSLFNHSSAQTWDGTIASKWTWHNHFVRSCWHEHLVILAINAWQSAMIIRSLGGHYWVACQQKLYFLSPRALFKASLHFCSVDVLQMIVSMCEFPCSLDRPFLVHDVVLHWKPVICSYTCTRWWYPPMSFYHGLSELTSIKQNRPSQWSKMLPKAPRIMSKMRQKSSPDTLRGRTLHSSYLRALKRRNWEGLSPEGNAHLLSKRAPKRLQCHKICIRRNIENNIAFRIVFWSLGRSKILQIYIRTHHQNRSRNIARKCDSDKRNKH